MLTGFVMEGLASGQIVSVPRNRLCLASRFASALDRCGLPSRAASANLSSSVPGFDYWEVRPTRPPVLLFCGCVAVEVVLDDLSRIEFGESM